jgi:hypothetical protein
VVWVLTGPLGFVHGSPAHVSASIPADAGDCGTPRLTSGAGDYQGHSGHCHLCQRWRSLLPFMADGAPAPHHLALCSELTDGSTAANALLRIPELPARAPPAA